MKRKNMSNNLWLGIKFLEASLENTLQLILMMWLLVPYYACLPSKMWTLIISEGFKGLANILSFNFYQPGDFAIKCGNYDFAYRN